MRDGINTLTDWLQKDIRFVSVSQQFDFAGITGKMIAAIFLAFAELELLNIRERQAAGIAAAKERGVYKGRKPGAVKAGVDPNKAIKLRERGFTQKEIAKNLGVSLSSVKRYLKTN